MTLPYGAALLYCPMVVACVAAVLQVSLSGESSTICVNGR